jgi:hypothetical protein
MRGSGGSGIQDPGLGSDRDDGKEMEEISLVPCALWRWPRHVLLLLLIIIIIIIILIIIVCYYSNHQSSMLLSGQYR